MQLAYDGFWLNPWILHFSVCYLHTLRVFCVSPNFNVKTLYSLSRERCIVFVSANYWSYCSNATLSKWFWQWTQKSLLIFGSIASETELSKPFWCICWWVIYRTTTSVDSVICWLHCKQMEWLLCWIRNNDFQSKVNSPNVLTWNISLNTALADVSVKGQHYLLAQNAVYIISKN